MNTYLIASDIIYYVNKKIKELTKDIQNIVTFNMDNSSLDDVLVEANYYSMFGDKKAIIVRNSNLFSSSKNGDSNKNKDDALKLCKYLENENKDSLLIFVSGSKVDTRKKIYSLLKDNGNVFACSNITKTALKNELFKIVEANNYKIDDTSLWYIINNSLNNFDLAINELNKIFIYYSNPCYIKYDDVIKIVSKNIEDNNFKLIESIINKDLDSSLKYLKDLQILKVEPSVIIALIYREFKLMLLTYLYEKNKYSNEDILKNLGLANWQFDKVKSNLYKYDIKTIKDNIVYLSDLDYKLKSGLISKDIILIECIMNLCS